MKWVTAAILLGIGIGLTVYTVLGTFTPDSSHVDYPPCVTEDSPGPCYWDAEIQGNGEGRSFLVHADGTVQYL
ncbi:hypothetical protein [Actinomadura sp. WMMB 499]|uniref:hypothetical protein n=1 Tax=Actinomadura sp. WMMB 499 TaxID=1219491 RepID=UPI001243B703|nr:hypothetical protein [Actinomadura sp. WMMB 499]QFG25415.1 hypothetical protein F7P10_33925 [Actinomadura sp. WMMB 499]